MNRLSRRSIAVLSLFTVLYVVGVIGHVAAELRAWMLLLTPWFLWGTGAVVLLTTVRRDEMRPLALWFVPVYIGTFVLEVVGAASGLIFGAYHYTPVLGTLFFGVPPVIGWNWVFVVWGVYTGAVLLFPRSGTGLRVLAVALGCVVFDLLLEPVAIRLEYWVWEGGAVPFQNYLAWGCIAALGAWWAEHVPRLPRHPLVAACVGLQFAFFAALTVAGVKT